MRLKDRVAIVTGGGDGIGKAIALTFASEGAPVVVAARTLSRLEEVVEEIKSKGGKATAIQTDISDEKQVQQMIAQTLREYGKVDILVNNSAAPAGTDDLVVDTVLDNWNKVITVNLTGTMLCSREVLKSMIPRKSGTIINMSSVAGISGVPRRGAYSSSKWGIIGFTASLSTEVGEYNIRVNSISPAATNSHRFENIIRNKADEMGITYEEVLDKILTHYSMKRVIDRFEVARVALCLASDDFSAVTGQNIVVDCGFRMLHPGEII